MSERLAIDVAILPPPDVSARAERLSAALPPEAFQGLRLGADRLPHVTLTQQFVRAADVEGVLSVVAEALRGAVPFDVRVTGGALGGRSAWMAIERTPDLQRLHEALMHALAPFEQADGDAGAFAGADARPADVAWVTGYRNESSFESYRPHVTLGHAALPPDVVPFSFRADMVAVCHLGRFCTCRRVLRRWRLTRSV